MTTVTLIVLIVIAVLQCALIATVYKQYRVLHKLLVGLIVHMAHFHYDGKARSAAK
jgi:hypothetical protein